MSARHTPGHLIELATAALWKAGVSDANAEAVARALVAAELDGLPSHGLSRLPFYADQAASGKVNGAADPFIETRGSVINVDARCGFAFRAIELGLSQAIERVRETGVVAVGVGNSHHFGVAGHHVEHAARQGLVALAFGNTPAAMAPWGGAKPVYGTNPIAFAVPRTDAEPLVIDLSLSKVARGKIMLAKRNGEAIPEGWALDAEGRPTTDATVALGGSMVPLGDAKGAALALMVEMLTAGLTGSNYGFEASSFFDAEGEPPRVAQLFLLLDPGFFGGGARFTARIEALLGVVTAEPGTRLPGDRRLTARARAQEQGVTVPEGLYRELSERAAR
jgi:(2R)-3-sulfolactate dehydrogenase (NADP+)